MKANEVKIDDLVIGRKYFFDDYSKDCGHFESFTVLGLGHDPLLGDKVSVKFTPILNSKYSVNKGKVGFSFNKNDLGTFYK